MSPSQHTLAPRLSVRGVSVGCPGVSGGPSARLSVGELRGEVRRGAPLAEAELVFLELGGGEEEGGEGGGEAEGGCGVEGEGVRREWGVRARGAHVAVRRCSGEWVKRAEKQVGIGARKRHFHGVALYCATQASPRRPVAARLFPRRRAPPSVRRRARRRTEKAGACDVCPRAPLAMVKSSDACCCRGTVPLASGSTSTQRPPSNSPTTWRTQRTEGRSSGTGKCEMSAGVRGEQARLGVDEPQRGRHRQCRVVLRNTSHHTHQSPTDCP